LLNIWLYAAFIYIFITKAQRIKLIPVSFALIALLFSIGPWSISNVTKQVLLAEIPQLTDTKKINDKVRYLRSAYGDDTVAGLDVPKDTYSFSESKRDKGEFFSESKQRDNEIRNIDSFNTFVEFKYFSPIEYSYKANESTKDVEYSFEKNLLTIKIPKHGKSFSVSLTELKDKMFIRGNDFMILGGDFVGLYYKKEDSVSVHLFFGHLLYNR